MSKFQNIYEVAFDNTGVKIRLEMYGSGLGYLYTSDAELMIIINNETGIIHWSIIPENESLITSTNILDMTKMDNIPYRKAAMAHVIKKNYS